MIFLNLLKSLDELLYEVISWLLFWPLTLWATLRHPRRMLAYAGRELHDAPEGQYSDRLQPPLFLVLSVLLIHAIELATVGDSPVVADKIGLAGIISDDTNLMMLRLISFGALPLILATVLVKRQGGKLDREVLRPHFYAQCYAAGTLAFLLGVSAVGLQLVWPWAKLAGLLGVVAAFGWFGLVQLDWFNRHLKGGLWRALWDASVTMVLCVAMLAVVAALFGGSDNG